MSRAVETGIFRQQSLILSDPNAFLMGRFYVESRGDEILNAWDERALQRHMPVCEWMKQARTGRVLFLPYVREQIDTLNPVPGWMDEGLQGCLEGVGGQEQQLTFMIDGVDLFERIGSLSQAAGITERGGRLILGMDSLEAFEKRYGEDAQAILGRADLRRF